jgi:hypothetical protein
VGLAEDLLLQARHLATYQGANSTQADRRRAVSTAYYALFHLLINDAARRWNGSPAAATGFERAFSHAQMKTASLRFDNPQWLDWHGVSQTVPPALLRIARSFRQLQDERHSADYNNHKEWTLIEVEDLLKSASSAFEDWQSVRTDPIAGDYLLSMLIGKPR